MKKYCPAYTSVSLLFASLFVLCSCSFAAAPQPVALPTADTPIADITFVSFDTETTGFGPKNQSILEIGAVKFKNGEVIEEKEWLINPPHPISYWAKNAHGITEDMLKDSPEFSAVFPEFKAFIGNAVLLAHNAQFDVAFMHEEIERIKAPPPPNPVLNSLAVFRAWFPEAESHSLEPLSSHLNITGGTYHRATADAYYVVDIFNEGIKRKPEPYTYGDLVRDAGQILHF
ncbi:MAG: hypothetical protein EOM20_10140 [Spartobacteria bacterium]|nr:hypothetical protein [Spartobacteria bacterium]